MGIFRFSNINKDPLDDEISNYERLSSDKPEDAGIKNTLGDLYFKKGLKEKAARYYKEAVNLFLKDRQKYKAVAILKKSIAHNFFNIETTEEILNDLLARGLKEDLIEIYVQLAKKNLITNRTFANDIFRKVLQIDPDNKEALSFFEKGKQPLDAIDESVEVSVQEEDLWAKEEIPEMSEETETGSPEPDSKSSDELTVDKPVQGINEPVLTDEKKRKRKKVIKKTEKPLQPSGDLKSESENSSKIKDKFLAVAKEKSHLETIILHQTDIIKKLEKEKSSLTDTTKRLSEDIKNMKEKLLDFDLLRNMEISELKKKIETLMPKNKKLAEEKELILKNRYIENLLKEKQKLENHLLEAEKELKDKDTLINRITEEQGKINVDNIPLIKEKEELNSKITSMQETIDELQNLINVKETEIKETEINLSNAETRIEEIEAERASLENNYREIEHERHTLKTQLDALSEQISGLSQEKSDIDDGLNQKINSYTSEISELRDKIDELSLSLEEKIKENEEIKEGLSVSNLQSTQVEKELHEKISSMMNELSQKDEILTEKTEAHEKEKEDLLVKISEYESNISKLEDEYRKIKTEIELIRNTASEYVGLIKESNREKKELEEQLSEVFEKVIGLEEELEKQQSVTSSKDQHFSELNQKYNAEISAFKTDIERLKSENAELKQYSHDMEETINLLSSEKSDLLERISTFDDDLNRIQNEKDKEISVITDNLVSALKKISYMETGLEESLKDKAVQPEEIQEIPEETPAEVHLDTSVVETADYKQPELTSDYDYADRIIFREKEKKRKQQYAVYTILFILLIVLSIFLYKFFSPKTPVQKPAYTHTPAVINKLSYNEILERMTQTVQSKTIKFQATLLTESLMQGKKALQNLSGVDFNRFFIFKVNISSLKDPINKDLIKNPSDSLRLSDEIKTILPAGDIKPEVLKTFYRNKQPVSIAFLCAFPKDNAVPDPVNLELLFNHKGKEMRLAWNIQSLKANKIFH